MGEDLRKDIIKIVQSIFSDNGFKVETVNESVLVGLMKENGTPITDYEAVRDIDKDLNYWKEYMR